MRHLRYIAATAAAALSYAAAAAEKTAVSGAAAAGGPYSDTATLAGIAQWFVSSIFVVALIFLCAYLARKLRLVPAARATTESSSALLCTTSSVWVPMDPVDPKIAMFFIDKTSSSSLV